MQFKSFLIPTFLIAILYHIPSSTSEVHETLYRKVIEVRQKMEQLNVHLTRLEEQAQAAVKEVERLKEENRFSKEYRDALEKDIEVEVMGFKNRNSICSNHNQLKSKQKNSICKKQYITFLKNLTK